MLLAERRDGRAPDAASVAGARRALLAGETTLAAVAEALDLVLRADRLAPISHWTTPPIMPRRFDTRFYAAELPLGAEPSFEADEVVDHRWLTAHDALEAMAAGEVAMWVPTCATLQQLEHAAGFDEIVARIAPGPAPAPRVVGEWPGLTRIVVGAAGAVPGQTANAYLVGQREVVVIDPGDPSDAAADAILGAVAADGGRLVAIALTHADPDHAAGAEALALRLDLPIVAGPGAGHDLPYLVRELADGERIAAGGAELEVVATPGPRRDHIAFVLRAAGQDDRREVIAGELVGPRAAKAVPGPPDVASWQTSLARLRARHPARIYPGHGEPLDALPPTPGRRLRRRSVGERRRQVAQEVQALGDLARSGRTDRASGSTAGPTARRRGAGPTSRRARGPRPPRRPACRRRRPPPAARARPSSRAARRRPGAPRPRPRRGGSAP